MIPTTLGCNVTTVLRALIAPRGPKKKRGPKSGRRWRADQSGQGIVEYTIVLSLIVLGLFTVTTQSQCSFRRNITKAWTQTGVQISQASGG